MTSYDDEYDELEDDESFDLGKGFRRKQFVRFEANPYRIT